MKCFGKFCLFFIILLIPICVDAESQNSFVESWSIDKSYTIETNNNFELFNKLTAYLDGFAVATIDESDITDSLLAIYNEYGVVVNEIKLENSYVGELAVLDDYLYVLLLSDEKMRIEKYDSNLVKQANVDVNATLSLELFGLCFETGMKVFKSFENSLLLLIDNGGLVFDKDLNIEREFSAVDDYDDMCEIVNELCLLFSSLNSDDTSDYYLGYVKNDNLEVYTGIYNDEYGFMKIKDQGEIIFDSKYAGYTGIFSPIITNNSIITLSITNAFSSVLIFDYFGKFVQTINIERDTFGLAYNEETNVFMIMSYIGDNESFGLSYKTYIADKEIDKETFEFDGDADDEFSDVIYTKDNSYVTVGYTKSTDLNGIENFGNEDAIVVKYDSSGNILWSSSFGGSENEEFTKVIETTDGGYVVIGSFTSTDIDGVSNVGGTDAVLIKYDKDGKIIWRKTFGGDGSDIISSIVSTDDGGFVAVGSTTSSNVPGLTTFGLTDALFVKFDKDGNIEWFKNNSTDMDDEYSDVINTGDGYVVVGYIGSGESSTGLEFMTADAIIVKYDLEGNVVWQDIYSGSGGMKDYYNVVVLLENGDYLVGGGVNQYDFPSPIIVRYDKDGNRVFEKVDAPAFGYDTIISTMDNGYIIVTPFLNITSTNFNVYCYLEKYDKDNNLEYRIAYDMLDSSVILDVIEVSMNKFILVGNSLTYDMSNYEQSDTVAFLTKLNLSYVVDKKETTNGSFEVLEENSRGKVILNPDKGYVLNTIEIRDSKGNLVDYTEENGNYYFDLNDKVSVNVTYKEEVINPNTITFLRLGFIICLVVISYYLVKFKNIKILRYS